MKRKLRLGILGTGVAARKLYLPAWPALARRIELVACANRRRERAVEYARLANISKVVDTAEQLIALPEVDAVLISLPIDLQPRYVLKALAAGKAVVSEKPVGPSVAAARRLLKAAARYPTPWLVAENYAFMPHVRKLEHWVKSGRLGHVRVVEAIQMSNMDLRNPYYNTAWRQTPKHVGGFVVDAGVHLAHVVRRCIGTPVEVRNFATLFTPELAPTDTAVAVLQFASNAGGFTSNAVGTWMSSFAAHYTGPILRVFGSKAHAELHSDSVVLRTNAGRETRFQSQQNSFTEEFRHFADVVLDGKSPEVTPAEALLDLELIQKIAGSAKLTRPRGLLE